MYRLPAAPAAVVLPGWPSQAGAQATGFVEPFNLATVDIAGREAVTLVLRSGRRGDGRRQLRPGSVMEATIVGIGALRNAVVAGPSFPAGSGAQLPAVSGYARDKK
jgi:hypothetical protein